MAEKKKNQKVYFIVFVVFVLILLGLLYYFVFWNKKEARAPIEEEAVQEANEQTNESDDEVDTSNWKTYENEEYGFSLKYPEGWGELIIKNIKVSEGSKIKGLILLESGELNKYVQIQVVKIENKNDPSIIDYPQTYITESNKYLYYYTSSNDCVGKPNCEEKEADENIGKIINTFKIK